MKYSFLLSAFVAVFNLGVVMISARSMAQCKERSDRQLLTLWQHHASVHNASLLQVPEYSHHARTSRHRAAAFPLTNQPTCSGSHQIAELSERSVCSWHHVITSSPDRYPKDMVEARRAAECGRHCLGRQGRCVELRYPVAIIKKTGRCDHEGFYAYEARWHPLVVGYTCRARSTMATYAA
ncbi:hypothetical protein CAPTEDRAFT_216301 [Capitella teleta]|uniref:Secreted protein n=1 Tax=Capitella teleta TaxID=283909 RepID=R7UJE8_CAPTE|nr:hypothetical protein CAPTEDRAFT_216301 [Capitella teleta]|eukprot:ELU03903.1 hypothetical protein CAPTEDRAFT_216301 [Capitella teleta]